MCVSLSHTFSFLQLKHLPHTTLAHRERETIQLNSIGSSYEKEQLSLAFLEGKSHIRNIELLNLGGLYIFHDMSTIDMGEGTNCSNNKNNIIKCGCKM